MSLRGWERWSFGVWAVDLAFSLIRAYTSADCTLLHNYCGGFGTAFLFKKFSPKNFGAPRRIIVIFLFLYFYLIIIYSCLPNLLPKIFEFVFQTFAKILKYFLKNAITARVCALPPFTKIGFSFSIRLPKFQIPFGKTR